MKVLFQTSTLLLAASIFTFAQAEAHAHAQAYEVRSPLDVEKDAASLEARDDKSYGGKKDHSSGSGWKGNGYATEYKGYGSQDSNDRYGNGEGAKSTSTVIINITEEGTYGYGMSTVAATGDDTSMMETMTISAVS